jgi:hypothetical protein
VEPDLDHRKTGLEMFWFWSGNEAKSAGFDIMAADIASNCSNCIGNSKVFGNDRKNHPAAVLGTPGSSNSHRSADILVGLLQADSSEPKRMSALRLLNRC